MFDRFTDRARKVMALAHQEAQRLNHDYIGTEHILLALAKEGSGVGASVLKNFGASPAKVRRAIELLVQPGPDAVTTHTPQTPRAKRVIEHAFAEARGLRHNYVGTEHLLLGMIREEESIAASVLAGLGIRLPDARDEVRRLLDTDAAAQDVRTALRPDPKPAADPLPEDACLAAACQAADAIISLLQERKHICILGARYEAAAAARDCLEFARQLRGMILLLEAAEGGENDAPTGR